MTKWGETNDFTVSDFTDEIEKFLGKKVDYVIYNTKKPSPKRLTIYKKEHPELLDLVRLDENLSQNKKFIGKDFLTKSGAVNHEPKKLIKTILNLCKL